VVDLFVSLYLLVRETRNKNIFVSTTTDESWQPKPYNDVFTPGSSIQLYRYEIYVPGGILVQETFGKLYKHSSEAEIQCHILKIQFHLTSRSTITTEKKYYPKEPILRQRREKSN